MITSIRWIFISLLFYSATSVAETDRAAKEYAIKAGFIVNFARYSSGGSINDQTKAATLEICGFSEAFINAAQQTLSTVSVYGKKVVVTQLSPTNPAIEHCDIVFSDRQTSSNSLNLVFDQLKRNQMLIGETRGFLDQGGHIRFFLRNGKIRFEIAAQRLEANGITLSSKVLRLGLIYDQ